MATKRQNIEDLTIAEKPLYFHIGRGGRNNNQGHVTFIDVKPFYEVADNEMKYYNAFLCNKDERGLFCKPYLASCADGRVISEDDLNGLYGEINNDNDYDTDIVRSVEDIKGVERYEEALKEAYKRGEVDEEIVKYLDLDVEEQEM